MQYIKHDVLQIYIFRSYAWLQIREIAKRSLRCEAAGWMGQTLRGSRRPFSPDAEKAPLLGRFEEQEGGGRLALCWTVYDPPAGVPRACASSSPHL